MQLKKVEINRRTTLGDGAYQELREAIISLRLKPGEKVRENVLVESLGISRTPVREALQKLSSEELVTIVPQKGAWVSFISLRKVKEAKYVRETLEARAFRDLASKWVRSDHHYEEIKDKCLVLLQQQRNAIDAGDLIVFLRADQEFHNVILEEANNQTMLQVISQMRCHLDRMRFLELFEPDHIQRLVKQHEELVEALSSGSESQTEKLLLYHFRQLDLGNSNIIAKYDNYFEE